MCNHNNPEGGHKCCGWSLGSKYRHQSLRAFFWALIVLGFVLAVGAGVETARFANQQRLAMKYAKAGYAIQPTGGGFRAFPRMIYRATVVKDNSIKLFGEIKMVEGGKITILNNAAEEQVVISKSNTQIYLDSKIAGISSLKEGQSGFFVGEYNKDGVLEAKVVDVK
jgi:hypothetical protein